MTCSSKIDCWLLLQSEIITMYRGTLYRRDLTGNKSSAMLVVFGEPRMVQCLLSAQSHVRI